MRIPRYFGHKVDQKEDGWRVCLAMARLPGECLDSWLRRAPPPNQDGPSAVRRGCALAMALIRQLGPTLERLAPHAWHRDVNSHNVLLSDALDGGRLMPCADVEETSKRACFWLLDFGLAVDAATWPQRWPHSDVAGDCRYWAASSFVMSFCGPEETAAKKDLCAQYRTKLDVVGLGLTALELLCSSVLASRESWSPDGLRGSWERLLETWERYRDDVTRWHTMIFQVFAKGGVPQAHRTPNAMGASTSTPSTDSDLRLLKAQPASSRLRQEAFERLRLKFLTPIGPKELLEAKAQVEALRFARLWPEPPEGATRLDAEVLADRVRGALFGAALGDAAGLATEFLSAAEAREFYGPEADFRPGRALFPDEHRMMWCAGDWTDDTDQQVLMMQSLLHSGGNADACDFASRLLSWRTSGFPELGDQSAAGLGQTTKAVLNDPDFEKSPHKAAAAHSASIPSNGGVMRTAVAGIPNFWCEDTVAAAAQTFCLTTHAEPRCVASCMAVALCVSRLLRGEDRGDADMVKSVVQPALLKAQELLPSDADRQELLRHAEARELRDLALDDRKTIGFTFKCLGSGLWALKQEGESPELFRRVMNELILAGGDADTNGAVAGALLGCRLGFSQLPSEWIAGMPYSSWLEAYVQKVLFMLRRGRGSPVVQS
ncbi:unnamed protein product [Symbiodinium natans]|uniref:Protein kinase domain-containing protein n=1 Tax=Symbiodinium natans TaxID=878477 RepID=A0A812PMQ9_9DINO|nr:unnamed protein product [Symbiodinium natans]